MSNVTSEYVHKTLDLVLTFAWYDLVYLGKKRIEYRAMKPRWQTLIWARRDALTHVRFRRGYSSVCIVAEIEKIDIGNCPYEGWDDQYYRIHFNGLEQEGEATSSDAYKKGYDRGYNEAALVRSRARDVIETNGELE